MKFNSEVCTQLANLVFGGTAAIIGCAATTTGFTSVSIASGLVTGGLVPAGIAAVALCTFAARSARKTGPERDRVLENILKEARRTWIGDKEYSFSNDLDIRDAENALRHGLKEISLTPSQIAKCTIKAKDTGFAVAAANEVIRRLDAWCENNDFKNSPIRTSKITRKYVTDVLTELFEEALKDEDYFASIQPALLVEIANEVGASQENAAKITDRLVSLEEALSGEFDSVKLAITISTREIISEVHTTKEEILAGFKAMLVAELDAREAKLRSELPQALIDALAEHLDPTYSTEQQIADLKVGFASAQARITFDASISHDDPETLATLEKISGLMKNSELVQAAKFAAVAVDRWKQERFAIEQKGELLLQATIDTQVALHNAKSAAYAIWEKIRLKNKVLWSTDLSYEQKRYCDNGFNSGSILEVKISAELCEIGLANDFDEQEHAYFNNNLGIAKRLIGDWGDNRAYWDAVTAYEAALEYHRDQEEFDECVTTQNNLGVVLTAIGRQGDVKSLASAINVFESALERPIHMQDPFEAGLVGLNIARALLEYAAWRRDSYSLIKAENHLTFCESNSVFMRYEAFHPMFSVTVARAKLLSVQNAQDVQRVIAFIETARELLGPTHQPSLRAEIYHYLGNAYARLRRFDTDAAAHRMRAIQWLEASREIYRSLNCKFDYDRNSSYIATLKEEAPS